MSIIDDYLCLGERDVSLAEDIISDIDIYDKVLEQLKDNEENGISLRQIDLVALCYQAMLDFMIAQVGEKEGLENIFADVVVYGNYLDTSFDHYSEIEEKFCNKCTISVAQELFNDEMFTKIWTKYFGFFVPKLIDWET